MPLSPPRGVPIIAAVAIAVATTVATLNVASLGPMQETILLLSLPPAPPLPSLLTLTHFPVQI